MRKGAMVFLIQKRRGLFEKETSASPVLESTHTASLIAEIIAM